MSASYADNSTGTRPMDTTEPQTPQWRLDLEDPTGTVTQTRVILCHPQLHMGRRRTRVEDKGEEEVCCETC